MHVTLTNSSNVTVDLPATVRWTNASAREFGSAQVTIPRRTTADSASYFDQDGGSLIDLRDPNLGNWRGVVTSPEIDDEHITLTAIHVAKWLDIRPVSRQRVLVGMTAGAIVRAALNDGLIGLGRTVIRAGTFVEAAPHIDSYSFTGQSVYQVITDMMEATGQEWSLSDDGALSWVPRTGTLYAKVLCQDGDLKDVKRRADVDQRLMEVIGVDANKREYVNRAGELAAAGFWPRAAVLTGRTPIEAARLSAITVAQRRTSDITYTMQLLKTAANHWASIRPGDFIQTMLPRAGTSAASPLFRVLAMGYADGDAGVELALQYVSPIDTTTILRAFMEGGASAPPPQPPPPTDPTPAINQTKQDVADINGRVERLEDANSKDIAASRMTANIVTAWNLKSGYNSTQLSGGVAGGATNNALLAGGTDVAGGQAVVAIKQATLNPSGTPTAGGVLYVDSATGALMYKGSSGTVTTVAPA